MRDSAVLLDATDARIVNALQRGFPLTPRPYADAARGLALCEDELLARLQSLLARGVLTRFGPLYQIERAGGRFVLCACHAPEGRIEAIAAAINAHPEVAHNYLRTHHLNIWFVLAVESAEQVTQVLARIEADAGVQVFAFPKEREFFVNLYLPVLSANSQELPPPLGEGGGGGHARWLSPCTNNRPEPPPLPSPRGGGRNTLDATDRALIQATQAGLPLVSAPFQALAETLRLNEHEVLQRFNTMHTSGLLRRFGAVPNHYALGWRANGMTVWDVDDEHIAALGERIGELPFVSHCYQRPRRPPHWPYNLFAMVHARTREEATPLIAQIRELLDPACRAHDVLWSTRILKKTGLRLTQTEPKD